LLKLFTERKIFLLFLSLVISASFFGCKIDNLERRNENANLIAHSAQMTKRIIDAGLFNLTSWERIGKPGGAVNLYIEGDGLAWVSKYRKSMNPTPPDPLTLRLAALDRSSNVIYLARPCQFSGWNGNGACPSLYWTNGRTAPEVLESFNSALDHIKQLYNISEFNLIGYSGGAAVAVLIASKRKDIGSIRTVAGNIHYARFTQIHNVSLMFGSIDPISVAKDISQIPQIHFIGQEDTVVPAQLVHDWAEAAGDDSCITYFVREDAKHNMGWAKAWPELLKIQPVCERIYSNLRR